MKSPTLLRSYRVEVRPGTDVKNEEVRSFFVNAYSKREAENVAKRRVGVCVRDPLSELQVSVTSLACPVFLPRGFGSWVGNLVACASMRKR